MDLKSIYDMSTRELRKEIRRRTAEANIRIAEYREAIQKGTQKASEFIEKTIQKLISNTSYSKPIRNREGKIESYQTMTPTSKKGEIGMGTSYKRKAELQKQLEGLRRFEKTDMETPEGKRHWNDKVEQQYKTFKERYGDISRDDYEDMIDTMNIVKNTLKDYGYEDNGTGYARLYNKSNARGKKKFARYVEQARNESAGGGKTVEDILDRVADLLRENDELS